MPDFAIDNVSSQEIERRRTIYGPLTQSVRELIDATIRTEVDPKDLFEVKAEIDSLTARLRRRQLDGAFGVRYTREGQSFAWGNPVVGLRNPVAPPLEIQRDGSGNVWADFQLGAAYVGPTGHVHGGVCAIVLDEILCDAATGVSLSPHSRVL